MKRIRFLLAFSAVLAFGHFAMAGGTLDGKGKEKEAQARAAARHMAAPVPVSEDIMVLPEAEFADELVTPQEAPAHVANSTKGSSPEAKVNETSPEAFHNLRMDREARKDVKRRYRDNKKEIREEVRKAKEANEDGGSGDTELILLVILALLLPPLAVFLYEGIGTNFWIDLILTLFFWLPGVIFALIVILAD